MTLSKEGTVLAIGVLISLFWALGAVFFPVIQDEAYYAVWAHHLAWGYFDHPPMVALLGQMIHFFPGSAFALRLGTLGTGILTILGAIKLFRVLGLERGWALPAGLLLLYGNLLGIVFGFLATPDTGLMLAWGVALHEAAVALTRDERRWITAGLATGCGILAKYTMLLIGPVFLWALIRDTRPGQKRGLKSPWPYAGGLAALLVCLPHLVWNAQHDWITFRFQLRHGLSLERPERSEGSELPSPLPAKVGSIEHTLAAPFLALDRSEKRLQKPRTRLDVFAAGLERWVGYYVSQIALWGGCLVAIVGAWRRKRRTLPHPVAGPEGLSPTIRPLVVASATVPLVVCGLLSLTSKVEANWSAMYVFGAAAWMAPWVATQRRKLAWGVALNLLVASGLIAHASQGILPLRQAQDRILAETHGYAPLAHEVQQRRAWKPVFAETYQIASMLAFYAPELKPQQWPGITRDSEFVRNPVLHPLDSESLRKEGGFWLVTTQIPPPRLPPYRGVELIHLRDCKASGLQVITTPIVPGPFGAPCHAPVHKWYLVRYTDNLKDS